jgi:acyl-CoA thioesterase superfamily protein/acyl-Coa thioesterase superfamily protein
VVEREDQEAFFTPDGDELIPAPHARGPWAPDMLHGRLLGGLMARAIEREHADDGLRFARLTVDLFRNSALVPIRVTTDRVRDGRRIRVVDAVAHGPDGPVARASALLLRRGEQPSGEIWVAPEWDAPGPEDLGAPLEGVVFDLRLEPAGFAGLTGGERRRAWLREVHELVAGEALSPFVRVALAADFVSPMSNFGSAGLGFINADYTLSLSRLPLGDAIGFKTTGHLSDEGVAAGQCTLYDTAGAIGFCVVSAVANRAL